MNNQKSLFEKFKQEITEELHIDQFNVTDVQMKLPGRKHKWAARLIQAKKDFTKLTNLKKEASSKIVSKLQQNQQIKMSNRALEQKADKHETIQKINQQIQEQKLLIEYLEYVQQIITGSTWDIKNLVELIKLEEQ